MYLAKLIYCAVQLTVFAVASLLGSYAGIYFVSQAVVLWFTGLPATDEALIGLSCIVLSKVASEYGIAEGKKMQQITGNIRRR